MGTRPTCPELSIQSFGYMYLADNEDFARCAALRASVQVGCGAATKLMTRIRSWQSIPFYNVDDMSLG